MTNEEYRELALVARDAIGDLIRASAMGTGAIRLNQMYGVVDEIARRHDPEAEGEPVTAPPSTVRTTWLVLDPPARERLVYEAIGDGTWTQRQVTDRVAEILPENITHRTVDDSVVYTALRRLMEAGEIDRKPGPVWKGRRIWTYFRRTELSGPIADIAKQLADDAS